MPDLPDHPITLAIPSALRAYCAGRSRLLVRAATVGRALDAAGQEHAGLLQHILTRDGQLRPFVNVFVRQEDVRHLQGLETPLHVGDTVMIVPSVAGG